MVAVALVAIAGCASEGGDEALGESEQGVAQIAVSHITWGTVGLDSNNVATGPNVFPVGVRITNTGDATATDVTAAFAFTTANANITFDAPSSVTVPSLAPGAQTDVYVNARVTRVAAAYNTSRGFQVTVSGTGFAPVTAATPRELFVEKIVSQNRNSIAAISGPTAVNTGETRTYVLDASTATGGYEQLEAFLTFPTSIFRVRSTVTTYTAPAGGTNDKVYADACGWDPIPTSGTYRSCIGPENFTGGKAGGTIRTTYTVDVIGAGTAVVTAAINDFSGSSYHYNSDFGQVTATVVATAVPVAAADSYTTTEDTTLNVSAPGTLANDSDPGNATLTAVLVSQPSHGTVTLNSDGSFAYVPAANYAGPDSFTYKANNGTVDSAVATVSLTVTEVNDPPNANDDTASVAKDAAATAIAVLANDTASPDTGETLSITAVTQPANGTVVITGGGTGLTFQPTAGFTGLTTFTYTISDGRGGSDTATVTVTVTASNSPPTAANDSATVAEDSGASPIAVLANDTDVDGDTLSITAVTQPANGTVVITGGGTGLTFQPAPNFHGSTTFTYTISDGHGGTSTATVSVTVTSVNDAPVAANDSATVAEDAPATAIAVLANDTDVDGDALVVVSATQPANGTVVITGGGTGLTFQPAPNFNGSTTFTYTISDGHGGTATATVSVTITSVNDAPIATNDSATVAEDSGATAIVVLANDSDVDGDALTITAVTQPANGTVVITGGGTGLTFQPAPNFNGSTTFSYTISDGHGGTATATVSVTVTPVNDAPVAVDDAATVDEDATATVIDVLGNDSDADGDALTVVSVTQPANGTVVITSGGSVTFQPGPDFHGTTSFTYTVSDGNGGTATATVTVTVVAVNDPPVAVDDAAAANEDANAMAIDVLANDSDVDGDTLTIESVTQPADGTVAITGGGTGVTFQPAPNFHGTSTFTYTISDGHGGTATATVTVTVAAVNDPPVAVDDVATVAAFSLPTAIDVLANDSDADGDALTITAVTQPLVGVAAITGGGTGVSFQPAAGFSGTTAFTYTISDGHGGTTTAVVTVTVTPAPDRDGDGVADLVDNCPDVPNTDQVSSKADGLGDACRPRGELGDNLHVSGGGCQATSSGSTSGGALVAIALAATLIGRRRRRAAAAVVGCAGAVVGVSTARADDIEQRNFSAERFQLAADRNGLFNVDWAEHPGDGAIDAAFAMSFVKDPLVVYKREPDNDRMIVGALISNRTTASLVGSFALHRRLSIGVDLPLVVYQDRASSNLIAPNGLESLSSFGLGNLRVVPRLTLVRERDHGVGVAVLAAVTLPTESQPDAYLGDHGFSIAPEVAVSRGFGAWRTGVNVGYLARQSATLLDLVVDDEMFVRAGVGYDLRGRDIPVDLALTVSAATPAADVGMNLDINHLETLLGATYQVDRQFQVFTGVGAGLAHGFGTPDARMMVGMRLTRGGGHPVERPARPVVLDRDGDGIVDTADKCPNEPEDRDGFEDDDGCPDLDNDKDGVPDKTDRCPLEPGVAEQDGCPVHAETPPPDPDSDGDTVVDRLDNCPSEKGTVENAGCPAPQLVKITEDRIDLIESVYFKLDKAIIWERSFKLLDNVAAVLASHPAVHVRVEGHTDSQGNAAYNKDLSQRRASAVVEYLVAKGIDRSRLEAAGFGDTQPIADNRTSEGRAHNRRVVFVIVGSAAIETRQQGADESTREK